MHQYQEKRWRGKQKTRLKHSCKTDRESVRLKEDVLKKTKWKRVIHSQSGDDTSDGPRRRRIHLKDTYE